MKNKQTVFYFHCQPNGSPDALVDDNGDIQWQARFTSWGKTEIELGEFHYYPQNRDQNLRFQGQYLDRETGLHYNTFRYYDPDIGRFTQHDPIGLAGGLNLYQYAPNGLVWVDPWGWEKCRLYKEDLEKLGPAPDGMKNSHRHHKVRENAPSNWSKKNRDYILQHKMFLNTMALI
ncbi:RHS repeat-associated core domain-containing protein [Proteus sp. fly-1008]|uniref:RHS repeat domain-containing protein n=1 Tax=Proteus sp. fly-1008 TaxID=3136672 RepID=UPI0032DB3B9C